MFKNGPIASYFLCLIRQKNNDLFWPRTLHSYSALTMIMIDMLLNIATLLFNFPINILCYFHMGYYIAIILVVVASGAITYGALFIVSMVAS